MKVLVLGGTGAMGVHLVQLLSDNGIDTVVTSRGYRCSKGNVRYIQGSALDERFLRTVLQEHWNVIVDFMVYTTSVFEKRAETLLAATDQYVFLSSARVYADSEKPIAETSPRLLDVSQDAEFLATDEYSLAKARQEDVLKRSGKTNWTIIRPYITYSENRLQLGVLEKEEWLYRAIHGRTIVFSSEINEKLTTLSYGLDIARGILSIIGDLRAFGETFHITTRKAVKWGDVLTIYLNVLEKHLGRRPKVLLQDLSQFMEWKSAKYQIEYDRLFDREFDDSKMLNHIDTHSFLEIESGLERCLKSFLKNPKFNNINWNAEALKDRQVKECALLKEIPGFRQKVGYLRRRYPTGIIKAAKRWL